MLFVLMGLCSFGTLELGGDREIKRERERERSDHIIKWHVIKLLDEMRLEIGGTTPEFPNMNVTLPLPIFPFRLQPLFHF